MFVRIFGDWIWSIRRVSRGNWAKVPSWFIDANKWIVICCYKYYQQLASFRLFLQFWNIDAAQGYRFGVSLLNFGSVQDSWALANSEGESVKKQIQWFILRREADPMTILRLTPQLHERSRYRSWVAFLVFHFIFGFKFLPLYIVLVLLYEMMSCRVDSLQNT